MSDEVAQPDFDTIDAVHQAGQAQARPRRYKRLLAIAAAVVVTLAAAGYGAHMLGFLEATESAEAPPVFFDLPEMTLNLNSIDERPQYLKIRAALEMREERVRDAITPVLPRVLDAFQVYLRELRANDLQGSAGIYRLKEELVRRVNIAIHPAAIDGVVFKEIIVQ